MYANIKRRLLSTVFKAVEKNQKPFIIRHRRQIPDIVEIDNKFEFDLNAKKNHFWYKYEISNTANKEGLAGIDKAINLLKEMKRLKIEARIYNYTPIINACAKAGYIDKAFEIFELGYKIDFARPTPFMVTSLINACAQCQDKDYAIKRLDWLETLLKIECAYEYNRVNNNVRIKAYSRLGQPEKAYAALKEYVDRQLPLDVDTYGSLMSLCTSNKESGLLEAIKLYKEMINSGIKPNLGIYRNLLHCVRFCGVGTQKHLEKMLKHLPKSIHETENESNQTGIPEKELPTVSNSSQKAIDPSCNIDLPSILDENFTHNIIGIDVDKLSCPWERFNLFGGLKTFFKTMLANDVKPDFKIFYPIVTFLPQDSYHQDLILSLYREHCITPTVEFYELLIRNISHNASDKYRLEKALKMLSMLQADGFKPTPIVFEMIAFACRDRRSAINLINDIERAGLSITPNLIINFLYPACFSKDMNYLIWILKTCNERSIRPKKVVVERLERMRLILREQLMATRESNTIKSEQYENFVAALTTWLNKVEIASD